jgi:3-oxoacyl-[acyl-carrier protein] reductase
MAENKIALVTGASKGIGAAIAVELAQEGFDIWLNYRSDDEGAESVAAQVRDAGTACTLVKYDVADEGATTAALAPLLEEATPFALINNAGFTRDTLMALMSSEEWKDVLGVHLDGFFWTTKLVVAKMLRKRQGRIVNIVSTSGEKGMAGQVNYSAAKAGLIGATKALASEIGRRNILVNAVSPGFIETEMTSEVPVDKVLPLIPLARFGKVEEVAGAVSFLCGPRAGYITGQVLAVNGGVYM